MTDNNDKVIIIEEEQKQENPKEEPKEETLNKPIIQKKPSKKRWVFWAGGLAVFFVIASALLWFVFHKKPTIEKPQSQPETNIKVKENLDLHFIKGLNLENKGNAKEAIEEFKKSKDYLFLAYLNIARIYQMQNNSQSANEYVKKAVTFLSSTFKNPNEYMDSYLYLFSYYLKNNQINKAKWLIGLLRDNNIKNSDIDLMQVYYDFYTAKNPNSVLNEINALLKNGYKDKLLYEMAGYINALNRNYDLALEYYSKASNLNYRIDKNLAFLEFAKNNLESALNYSIESLNKHKDDTLSYFAYLIALKTDQMSTAYDLISNINPNENLENFSIIPTVKQDALAKQINFKNQGIAQSLQALLIMQSIGPINYNINPANNLIWGDAFFNSGLLDQAKESYLSAIKLEKSLDLSNKALALFKSNDLAQSLQYYKLAYDENPSNPILYYNLALLYEKNNNFAKAKQLFSVLINRYPNFPLPYFNMALIHFTEGSMPVGYDYLNKFKTQQSKLTNSSLKVYDNYADLLLGRPSKTNGIPLQSYILLKELANNNFDYLKLEKKYLNDTLGIHMDSDQKLSIVYVLSKFNPDLNRLLANMYLEKEEPEKAIKCFSNLNDYSAQDYYKMGICYMLLGFKNQADNYLTKAILLSKNDKEVYNQSIFAKLIMQIMNKNIKGIQELTKSVSSNRGLLSFDIQVKK